MKKFDNQNSLAAEPIEPNLVPLSRTPLLNEPPLPGHIRDQQHQDVSSEVSFAWEPHSQWESLEGTLVKKTPMSLGGTAYVFDMRKQEEIAISNSNPRLVLLKRGGRILDSYMQHVGIGAHVYVRYCGELEPKPGQNPARDWRVVKVESKKKSVV